MTDKLRRWSLPFLSALLLSQPAVAWNAAGHRLVASIAWDNLTPEVRSEASKLLRAHLDYDRWLRKVGEDDPDQMAFIEASTWSDEIRHDSRFYDAATDEPTMPIAGFPDTERHRNWHYINRPLEELAHQAKQVASSGLLDKQLVFLAKILRRSGVPDAERSYALPWLIHLVGDAHQPLHVSVRLDADGKWDKLGNGLTVMNPFNPKKPRSTLHAFWDDLPGPSSLRGDSLETAKRALVAIHPRPRHGGSSDQWIDESWRIARDNGYPDVSNKDEIPTISEAFYENSREIARRRVVEAGYRLADLLNSILKPKHRE